LIRSAILDYVGRKAGMDYFSLRMHRELCNLGIQNTLYTNFSESSDDTVRHVFPWEAGPRNRWSSTLGYVTGILRTFQGIRRQKSQHFIFHYFKGGLREALVLELARWHGQRIHLLVHDVERLDQSTPHNWFSDFMERFLRRRIMVHGCHHAYTFSQAAAVELLQHAPNLKGRLTVLRHGHFLDLPLPVPTQAQARQALQIKEGTTTLLFFGQIKASKGLDILLEAMNLVQDPDVHLVIAGSARDVDPQERIQTLVKPSVQERIHLHQRYIHDQERDAWFKACDVLVVPYRRIYNSGVLMMGLSYGKTVIASDLPANQEIIQHGINGYLFENGNPLDLAQSIIRLTHASNRPSSESILNKLKVNHSWDLMAQQMKPSLEA
jgi:glycosyltransferase involved in cell wall biosynthesis